MGWRMDRTVAQVGRLALTADTEMLDGEPVANSRVTISGEVTIDPTKLGSFQAGLRDLIERCK
jgi:hypothetical protein